MDIRQAIDEMHAVITELRPSNVPESVHQALSVLDGVPSVLDARADRIAAADREITRLSALCRVLRETVVALAEAPMAPEPEAVEAIRGNPTLSRDDLLRAGRLADVLATELLNAAHTATADSRYLVTIAVHEQLAELAGLLGLRVCTACTLLPAVDPTNSPEDEIEHARRLA